MPTLNAGRENGFQAFLVASGVSAILGIPWLVDASFQSLPLSLHGVLPEGLQILFPLYVSVSLLFLYGYQSHWIRSPPYFSMTSS